MPEVISIAVRVSAILEHHRTIRGGKDALGKAFTEEVNMGYYIHLELPNGEPFGVAIGIGSERPAEITEGSNLLLSLRKV